MVPATSAVATGASTRRFLAPHVKPPASAAEPLNAPPPPPLHAPWPPQATRSPPNVPPPPSYAPLPPPKSLARLPEWAVVLPEDSRRPLSEDAAWSELLPPASKPALVRAESCRDTGPLSDTRYTMSMAAIRQH